MSYAECACPGVRRRRPFGPCNRDEKAKIRRSCSTLSPKRCLFTSASKKLLMRSESKITGEQQGDKSGLSGREQVGGASRNRESRRPRKSHMRRSRYAVGA